MARHARYLRAAVAVRRALRQSHALAERGMLDAASPDNHMDFYHWAAVLRSVSAFEVYRKVYSDVITPARVAELLMLRGDMPRSLMNCMNEVVLNLEQVRNNLS